MFWTVPGWELSPDGRGSKVTCSGLFQEFQDGTVLFSKQVGLSHKTRSMTLCATVPCWRLLWLGIYAQSQSSVCPFLRYCVGGQP